MKNDADRCELLLGGEDLDQAIRTRERLFVLFYASWCPFSMAFLPEYVDHARSGDPCYVRILSNDGDAHVEKYRINVFPTVLYFEKGRVVRRLDGRHFVGLDRRRLEKFVGECGGAA